MIDWNLSLKLGLSGLAIFVLCGIWFVVRAVRRQGVPRPWLVGLGVLFLVSALTTVGSQVTVVSKLSPGDTDDAPHSPTQG